MRITYTLSIVELDFARCIGTIAELVLQALDIEWVSFATGQPTRNEKARWNTGRARFRIRRVILNVSEDEKTVAHRRRTKPSERQQKNHE